VSGVTVETHLAIGVTTDNLTLHGVVSVKLEVAVDAVSHVFFLSGRETFPPLSDGVVIDRGREKGKKKKWWVFGACPLCPPDISGG